MLSAVLVPRDHARRLQRSAVNKRLYVALCAIAWLAPSIVRGQGVDSVGPTLQPGDLVRIAVWQKPEFSGEFVIAPDGSITHPLYRGVRVAGVPLSSAEDRVRQFLTQFVAQPAFSFSPLLRVFVGGEVRLPNTLTLPPGTTVAQAIALVGGPTEQADLAGVRLVRAERVLGGDLTSPDATLAKATIRSGDQILVARTKPGFRDAIAPVAAVIAALSGIASIVIQLRR
jgi:protein involved in polysaccharide export with SLBB domain